MGMTASGLPWPEGDEPVRDGDDSIRALAEAVDTRLAGVVDTTPGVFTSGVGVRRILQQRIRVVGSLAQLSMQIEIGSFPTSNSWGNITDVAFYTLESRYQPVWVVPMYGYNANSGMMATVWTNGIVTLRWISRNNYKIPSMQTFWLTAGFELKAPVYPT